MSNPTSQQNNGKKEGKNNEKGNKGWVETPSSEIHGVGTTTRIKIKIATKVLTIHNNKESIMVF